MRYQKAWWLVTFALLMTVSPELCGQETGASGISPRQRATQEIERTLAETSLITDKAAFVKVRAKVANLVWLQDKKRSRQLFDDLWTWIETQDDKNFDRDEARTVLLKQLFPRDTKLASGFLNQLHGEGRSEGGFSNDKPSYKPGHLNELASGLLEDDAATAARLIEQSLAANFSPVTLNLLANLRKKDPDLADGIVSRVLASLRSRPSIESLPAAYLLTEYLFPSRASTARRPADALLRQFFLTSYPILLQARHQAEREPPNADARPDRQGGFRAFVEAHLAGVLLTLATRYAPERVAELDALSAKLSASVTPEFKQFAQLMQDHVNNRPYQPEGDTPADALAQALINSNFDEAKRLLEKIENQDARKFYAYEIAVKEFKAEMAQENFQRALLVARGIEHLPTRASMLAQVAKAAQAKGDTLFSQQILSDARNSLSNAGCDEKKVAALFSLATAAAPISANDSIELINSGTSCINSLRVSASGMEKKSAGRMGEFIDSSDLQQAFASAGKVDLDNALLSAGKLEDRPTSLIARLAACEPALNLRNEKRTITRAKTQPAR